MSEKSAISLAFLWSFIKFKVCIKLISIPSTDWMLIISQVRGIVFWLCHFYSTILFKNILCLKFFSSFSLFFLNERGSRAPHLSQSLNHPRYNPWDSDLPQLEGMEGVQEGDQRGAHYPLFNKIDFHFDESNYLHQKKSYPFVYITVGGHLHTPARVSMSE